MSSNSNLPIRLATSSVDTDSECELATPHPESIETRAAAGRNSMMASAHDIISAQPSEPDDEPTNGDDKNSSEVEIHSPLVESLNASLNDDDSDNSAIREKSGNDDSSKSDGRSTSPDDWSSQDDGKGGNAPAQGNKSEKDNDPKGVQPSQQQSQQSDSIGAQGHHPSAPIISGVQGLLPSASSNGLPSVGLPTLTYGGQPSAFGVSSSAYNQATTTFPLATNMVNASMHNMLQVSTTGMVDLLPSTIQPPRINTSVASHMMSGVPQMSQAQFHTPANASLMNYTPQVALQALQNAGTSTGLVGYNPRAGQVSGLPMTPLMVQLPVFPFPIMLPNLPMFPPQMQLQQPVLYQEMVYVPWYTNLVNFNDPSMQALLRDSWVRTDEQQRWYRDHPQDFFAQHLTTFRLNLLVDASRLDTIADHFADEQTASYKDLDEMTRCLVFAHCRHSARPERILPLAFLAVMHKERSVNYLYLENAYIRSSYLNVEVRYCDQCQSIAADD